MTMNSSSAVERLPLEVIRAIVANVAQVDCKSLRLIPFFHIAATEVTFRSLDLSHDSSYETLSIIEHLLENVKVLNITLDNDKRLGDSNYRSLLKLCPKSQELCVREPNICSKVELDNGWSFYLDESPPLLYAQAAATEIFQKEILNGFSALQRVTCWGVCLSCLVLPSITTGNLGNLKSLTLNDPKVRLKPFKFLLQHAFALTSLALIGATLPSRALQDILLPHLKSLKLVDVVVPSNDLRVFLRAHTSILKTIYLWRVHLCIDDSDPNFVSPLTILEFIRDYMNLTDFFMQNFLCPFSENCQKFEKNCTESLLLKKDFPIHEDIYQIDNINDWVVYDSSEELD